MTTRNTVELVVVNVPIRNITAYSRNARTHSKHQIRQIADSIRTFGFLNPAIIDGNNQIIAGHGRVAAATLLGIESVPTIQIEHLSPDQVRAYILADNKLAENAGWDKEILAIELQHLILSSEIPDVTLTGFEVPEIDLIIQSPSDQPGEEDEHEIVMPLVPITQLGDLWQLGRHRILCANSLEDDAYKTLFGGNRASAVFSDPPFNCRINGHVSGNGQVRHDEFPMASGEMTEGEFTDFLAKSLGLMAHYSAPGAVHYICIDWRHQFELLRAGKSVYDELLNVCVWVKNNGGMGSFYRSQHELVFAYRNRGGRHRNNIQLGKHGRNRTNVWQYPNASTFSKTGEEGNLLALHPTVKPVAMVADAILDCTKRSDIVLDAFLGSGSTLMAAERVGRICYGIELEPRYVDVAIQRWQRLTGESAINAQTGRSYAKIAADGEVVGV
jgi:DNA methylase/ParB-like nuclease domain